MLSEAWGQVNGLASRSVHEGDNISGKTGD